MPALYSKRITFQHTFKLPERRNNAPKAAPRANNYIDRKGRQSSTKLRKPKTALVREPDLVSDATGGHKGTKPKVKKPPEERKDHQLTKSQTPARKEHLRNLRRRSSQAAKQSGKCVDCPNRAIENQTRCEACAEQHRQDYKRRQEKKKAANPDT